jgi:hypothetical protein
VPPRAILRLTRGDGTPSSDSPLRSRPPRARDTGTHSPDQSINCYGTPRALGSKGESSPLRPSDTAWESYPGAVPQTHPVRPFSALCGKAGVNSMALCRLLPYGFHVAPLEKGRWNPRKRYGCLSHARAGQRRDIGPEERVSSVTSGPVWPSPLLYYHLEHYSTIRGAVGARDDKTPPRLLLCVHWPSVSRTLKSAYGRKPNGKLPHGHPRSRSWTGTGIATTPDGSKIR